MKCLPLLAALSCFFVVGCGTENSLAERKTPAPPPEIAPTQQPTSAPQKSPVSAAIATPRPNFRLPSPPQRAVVRDAQIAELEGKIARAKVFAAYEKLIDIYKTRGHYDLAANLAREQVPLYRAKGLDDAATIQAQRAQSLETRIETFGEVSVPATQLGGLYTGATNEPFFGCYNGAFIDRDDSLGQGWMDNTNFQTHRDPQQFTDFTGRRLATTFMYLSYGRPFPSEWVARLKAQNVIPHIAWEPHSGLNNVRDDAYLRGFAAAARAADWPIFIRFASEMNGKWTKWHGNPTLYKAKFRLAYNVVKRRAPRVAFIWCVNNPPLGSAHDYYPGDDGTDWVGVNFYSVPFADNDRNRPVHEQNPLALLDPIYARYATKKPIALCEFAASHRSIVENRDIADFSVEKLRLVYGALPLLYPRVKMINWFSMNTIKYVTPGKTRSNYDLTDNARVLAAWKDATNTAHFLDRPATLGSDIAPVPRPLRGQNLRRGSRLHIFARSFDADAQVFAAVDGQIVFRGQGGGAFEFPIEASAGPRRLTVYIYDSKNRFQKSVTVPFRVI